MNEVKCRKLEANSQNRVWDPSLPGDIARRLHGPDDGLEDLGGSDVQPPASHGLRRRLAVELHLPPVQLAHDLRPLAGRRQPGAEVRVQGPEVQGDRSGCALGCVDIKIKVAL